MSKSKQTETVASTAAPVESYADHLASLTTKSAQIRFLHAQGLSRGQIAKALGIRYQWVRNVLITPLKKAV